MINPDQSPLAEKALSTSSYWSCGWKDLSMIAVAIAGISASIFAKSTLGAIGFALFGISVPIKKYEDAAHLLELERQIKSTLERETKLISHSTDQMQEQIQQAEVDQGEYKQTVQQLEQNNQRLQNLEKSLSEREAKFTTDLSVLKKEKQDLQSNLEAAQENIRQFRIELQNITAENLRFGLTTGVFSQNVQSLSHTKEQLEQLLAAFSQNFDGDMKNLVRQIQIAKEASKALIDSCAQRNEELAKDLQNLRAETDQRHGLEEQLQASIAKLDRQGQEIEQRAHELGEKEASLWKVEQEIAERQKEFEEKVIAFQRGREEIAQEQKQMLETAQKLEETVRLKNELIQGLDQKILAKEEQLKKLKAEIIFSIKK